MPSDTQNPSASSSSWPGVRIVTATGAPPMRISSGSSTATASRSVAPAGRRTTSTDALEYGGASTAPRSLRLVERAAAADDVVEHRAVAVDRGSDVTGAD